MYFNRLNRVCVEIVTEDVLREGKRQLQRYRKHMERKCQRKEFKGKLNSAGASKDEGTSILGSFMNLFSAKGGNGEEVRVMVNPIDNDEESGLNAELVVPSPLTGVLERKAEKKMMGGGGWKQWYVDVSVCVSY